MSNHKERQRLFDQLFAHRQRTLLTLITSTKKPELFATQIAQDILPIFYQILSGMQKGLKLDILIYSSGGQIDVPWPLVNLLREYTDDIHALIPWRAHSAATLLVLGANSIGMGPLASLSPIDPQFQLRLPDKQQTVGASVEDVYGYYRLVNEIMTLDSAGRSEALKLLASRISPEVLGKISRVRREIRIIATNLLHLHMQDEAIIEKIVNALVEELPSHQYLINRKEAADLGLPVYHLDESTEPLSFQILDSYVKEAAMEEPGMAVDFGPDAVKMVDMNRAFIETRERSFVFRTKYTFHRDGKVEKKGDKWEEAK